MMTIIVTILMFIEHRKSGLTKDDFKYAFMFISVDIIDFTIAYFLFT